MTSLDQRAVAIAAKAFFILLFLNSSLNGPAQVPAAVLAPEEPAFNAAYPDRPVPKLSGKLLNLNPGEASQLSVTYVLVTPFSKSQRKGDIDLQPDGSFSLTMDYAMPYQQIWFSVGDWFYAVLYLDKDLFLELDLQKIKAAKEVNFNGDGVRYLGTDGPLTNYMNNAILHERSTQLRLGSAINDLSRRGGASAESLVTQCSLLYDTLQALDNDYISTHPSPYSWLLRNERTSEFYGHFFVFYWGEKMPDRLWERVNAHKAYAVSNSGCGYYEYLHIYLKFIPGGWSAPTWKDVAALTDLNTQEKAVIDTLKINEHADPADTIVLSKNKMLIRELNTRLSKLSMDRSVAQQLGILDSLYTPAKADYLKMRIPSESDLNDAEIGFSRVIPTVRTSWCKKILDNELVLNTRKLNEINDVLAHSSGGTIQTSFGKPILQTPYGASLYKVSNMAAKDFLANLKKSFPGRAIVLDLWATWCMPCLGEMPHSKKLEEESKGLPVVFVYLCTASGSTEDKWKTKVVEMKQPGVHFFIDTKLDAGIAGYFSFSGYPGTALIDKQGKYRPGAITRISHIANRDELAALIGK